MTEEILKRECFVAVIDILGFGGLVKKNKLENVVLIYKEFKEKLEDYLKKMPEITQKFKIPAKKIELKIFSDTLVLYTVDIQDKASGDIEPDFVYFLFAIGFIYQTAIDHELLLRGATAFGEIYVDGDLLIGEPIVDAYEREKQQAWSGCWISMDCLKKVFGLTKEQDCERFISAWEGIVIGYKIPLKGKKKVSKEYALNWIREDDKNYPVREKTRELIIKEGKKDGLTWDVKNKLDNTMKFIEHIDVLYPPNPK